MSKTVVCVGDIVQWSNGIKPLGRVVSTFVHRQLTYAIVEDDKWNLKVVRVYEKLLVISNA